MNASSNSTQNLFEIFDDKSKRLLDLKSVFIPYFIPHPFNA